jgi:putative cell wall-binding protein
VIVLGGQQAVGEEVEAALGTVTGAPVRRLAGSERTATAIAVSRAAFPDGAETAYVATAADFADGLVGGAAAATGGAPLLLVDGGVSPGVAAELERLAPERIVALGGEAAISPATLSQLRTGTGAVVERLAGPDRYGTAGAVAAAMEPAEVGTVYIASGVDFPDALVAGPAVAAEHGALLLVTPSEVPDPIAEALNRLRPSRIVILGGQEAIHDTVAEALRAYIDTGAG